MVIRTKITFRIFIIIFFGILIYMSKNIIITPNSPLQAIIFFLIFDLIIICLFFIFFTKKITLNSNGLTVNWYIGIYPLKIERKNYIIYWNDITYIYRQYPFWFPLNYIQIVGKRNGRRAYQTIGNIFINEKETLLFIAQHVHKDVFDSSTWKLVQKYKKQFEKKNIYTYMK